MTEPRIAASLPHCDCRADDWIEGDEGAIRCMRCGGYAGELGTSIHIVDVDGRAMHADRSKIGVPDEGRPASGFFI